MKWDWTFPRQVLLALVGISAVGLYPLLTFGTAEIIRASLVGALLSTLNVLVGYAAIEYSFGKSTTTFFKYVLGGMGIRLFASATLLVVFIKFLNFPAGTLVGSMGLFYVVFLALEVLFIQKKINIKQQ